MKDNTTIEYRMQEEFQKLTSEAKRLRKLFIEAEIDFFLWLFTVETTKMSVLAKMGYSNIEAWIRKNKLCLQGRYENFRDGFRAIRQNVAHARIMGVDAVITARLLSSQTKTNEYIEAVVAHNVAHDGVSPKQEWSRQLAAQIDPKARQPKVIKYKNDHDLLVEENKRLKNEVRSLKTSLQKSNKELGLLRSKINSLITAK